jgi:L-amino acid N-acyltransferase YncA
MGNIYYQIITNVSFLTMQSLTFREAEREDIPAIIKIHNSNVRGQPGWRDRGFLLAPTTEEEVLQNLARSSRYFVTTDGKHEVVGFIALAQPKISEEMLNKMSWEDESVQTKLVSDYHFYINIVATRTDCTSRGIARLMYESVFQQFPPFYFSAFVVTQPITNARSLIFHEKQGFKRIGVFRAETFLDLKNYESVLFLKET